MEGLQVHCHQERAKAQASEPESGRMHALPRCVRVMGRKHKTTRTVNRIRKHAAKMAEAGAGTTGGHQGWRKLRHAVTVSVDGGELWDVNANRLACACMH